MKTESATSARTIQIDTNLSEKIPASIGSIKMDGATMSVKQAQRKPELVKSLNSQDKTPAENVRNIRSEPARSVLSMQENEKKFAPRAFAVEVSSLVVPTEAYERFGEKTPPIFLKETPVSIVVSTYANCINWFIVGPMSLDGQKFRDEVYLCASRANSESERGCGNYYRGTNDLHVKRQHADAFEAMYNHNHYPQGGVNGSDFDAGTFPADVSPEEFREHLTSFLKFDAELHDGIPRFISKCKVDEICELFSEAYHNPHIVDNSGSRAYNEKDIEELALYGDVEKPCKSTGRSENTRGIHADKADERQPIEYSKEEYKYVLESRIKGREHLEDLKLAEKKMAVLSELKARV